MAAPAKFLFDVDFSASGRGSYGGHNDAAAESRGYRSGFEAAQREAAMNNDRRLADASAAIATSLASLADSFAGSSARIEAEAMQIAVTVARKLAGRLIAAEPLAEITALVTDCLRQLVSTPHLVVRINEALHDGCRAELDRLARNSGFQGKLVILAEPDIATGDCRIEWADGGMVREGRGIDAQIDELVGRYLASRSAAAEFDGGNSP